MAIEPDRIVKSTSFSRASDYEKCPLMFKYKYLDKIPDPAPELPEGEEHPMDRGSRIHELCENYVKNPLIKPQHELRYQIKLLDAFRAGYERGKVDLEIPIAFDASWNVSAGDDFENTVYRMIIDVAVTVSDTRICILDWKTGRKQGNEVKHHQQLMEYAVGVAAVDPEIQIFDTMVAYLDLKPGENVLSRTFTRTQVERATPTVRARHEKVLNATLFPAKPSRFACMFCPYKAGMVGSKKRQYPGTGHCRRNVC